MNEPDWLDKTADANGIGPVCKHCHRLIDTHPEDHSWFCPVTVGSTEGGVEYTILHDIPLH